MVAPIVKTIAYKAVLPIALITAAVCRPSIIAAVYAIFGLLLPLLPSDQPFSPRVPASVRSALFALLAFTLLFSIGQVVFQSLIAANVLGKYTACDSGTLHWILRIVGYEKLYVQKLGPWGWHSIVSEPLVLAFTVITVFIAIVLKHPSRQLSRENTIQPVRDNMRLVRGTSSSRGDASSSPPPLFSSAFGDTLRRASNMLIIILIGIVGCIQPSVLSAPYFLVFLFVLTWYSLHKSINHEALNKIKVGMILYSAFHFIAILVYQISAINLDPKGDLSFIPRILGLSKIVDFKCSPDNFDLDTSILKAVDWPHYLNPLAILCLFQLLIWQYEFTKNGTHRFTRVAERDDGSSVHEELLGDEEGEEPSRRSIPLRKITSQHLDRQRITQILRGPSRVQNVQNIASQGLVMFISFFFSQSYVLGLLAMMVWALLYHSVFGIALLVLACFIWLFPNSRRAAFVLSPAIVAYVEFLLVAQYIMSMDIVEWRHALDPSTSILGMVGFVQAPDASAAFVTILVKLLLSLPIFLILRLAKRDRKFEALNDAEKARRMVNYGTFASISAMEREEDAEEEAEGDADGKNGGFESSLSVVSRICAKIWLPFVFLVIVYASCYARATFFNIVYFIFFSILVILLKCSFPFFRHTYFGVLTVLTAYASFVIIATYSYQFNAVYYFWGNITNLTNATNRAIGLEKLDIEGGNFFALFGSLGPSIGLYIVTILQLKMFHSKWKDLTEPIRGAAVADSAQPGTSASSRKKKRFNDRVGVFIEKTMEIFWRIMEVHITRIVLLVILSVIVLRQSKDASDNAVLHYEALNLPLVILICVAVILPRGASNVACLVVCLYICALAIVKMVYQALNNIDKNLIPPFNPPSPNCTTGNVTYMQWMGFRKAEEDNTWSLVKDLLVSILLLAIQSVVFYRMKYLRSEKGEAKPNQRILVFPSFAPADLDKGLCASLAWLVDYTFYKFGVEISVIALSIDVWVRMDGIAVISCAFIVIIVLSPRSLVRAVWPVLMAYLAIMIPLQYAMHVGLPPAECQEYPWQPFAKEPPMPQPLAVMLSLPLYKVPWQASYFVLDFLALLCVAAQLFVFHEESVNHPAGDNKSIYVSREFRIYPENPHYDFVTKQKSFVDYAKIVVFQYGHWVSLLFVLIAGLGGTSLFALGYIVLSLSMLWEGNNLYLMKNHRRTIWRWKLVLLYTSVVMMCKVALQLIGCLSISPANIETNLCVIAQLFAIKCVCNNVIGSSPKEEYVQNNCAVGDGEAAIGFDAFALAFALFQIRVICSWYFQYCVIEFRSEIVLANRGAVLSNQLIEKEMKEQEEQQTRKFAEIKDRTKSIRERYEELQRNDVIDPDSYAHAKRAGDYYMFDYDPARDELKKDKESFVPEADPGSTEFNKLDPTQLAYAAVTKNLDLKGVVDSVEDAESRAAQEAEALGTRADKKKMVLDVVKNDKSKSRSVSSVGEGTSGAQVQSETEEDETQEEEKEPENESTIVSVGRFIGKCVSSTMDWFAAFFNRRSREHRYVAYVLSKERQKLKQKKAENLNDISRRLSDVYSDARGESGIILVASESDISKMEEAAANSWQKKNVLARLINAFGHCVAAHTDILCYMIVFICHARGAGLITLPLPAFVLFWGTLSNPRPSKFFWVTLILYTEIILVIKFIFQFGFWPMNSFDSVTKAKNEPYSWPALLGVQKAESYCFWEVALLMALFFHRYMLRKLGLWKDANVSETFDGEQPNGGGNSGERGISNPALDTPESSPREEEEAVGEGRGVLGPLYSIREESSPGKYSRNGPSEAVESVEASNVGGEVRELDYAVYAPGGEDEVDGGEADKQRSGFGRFIYQLLFPKFRDIRDLYPAMFGLDVLCFLIIIFSYSSFGDGGSGSGVLSDIQNNRVPITFVIMMIVLSFLMVIDRGLYLRKAVRCKLVFQALLIIFMHVWIFFVLPWITKKQACTNKGAQVIYVVKCIYFLFSAWQIRNGYPQLCVGNLIMHSYGLANLVFFKVFMLVPFVFELRTAIDWTWTDTSMPLFDFFNMEQFYATIYNLKCMRSFEDAYPAARGEKKGALVKYAMGLSFVIILILLIWCPLVAFALLNKVGQSNPPDHVRLSVAIQGYPPLYTIESQGLELQPVTYKQFEDMKDNYAKWASKTNRTVKLNEEEVGQASRTAVAFIDDFSQEDVYLIQFRPESQSRWEISNASTAALSDMLQNYKPESLLDDDPKRVTIDVLLTVTRRRFDKQKEPQTHTATFSSGVDADLRDRILKALKDKSENVIIPSVFPRAIHIPSEGEVTAASALLNLALDQDFATTSPAKKHPEQSKINLRYQNIDSVWTAQVRDNSSQFAIDQLLIPPSDITYVSPYAAQGEKLKYLEMVAFTTRVFPSFLSKFVSGGIIAMYFALVLLAGRVIRGVLTNSPLNVMITEIPNPDHLLKICLDIYLVREAKDFVLEQDLFAKLIFLFRSPSTLIKWTRLRPSKKND